MAQQSAAVLPLLCFASSPPPPPSSFCGAGELGKVFLHLGTHVG